MQKKLIALAVAGVLAAPLAAQAADVEVYGKMRLSVGLIGNDDDRTNPEYQDQKLNLTSHASRLGIKGSEEIGGGTKFMYQLETTINIDESGSNGLWGSMRNTYVGIGGDSWGQARFGRHDTPYKIATGKLDPFKDTHGDYNAVMGLTHDIRSDNVLAYISPSFSGFTFAGAYVTDAVDDELIDSTPEQENPAYSLAGIYDNGTFFASLAYQTIQEFGEDDAAGKADDATGTKLGLGYNWGSGMVGFVYEMDDWGGAESAEQDRYYFSVDQGFGNGMSVQLAYGAADDVKCSSCSNAETDATFFAIGGKMEHSDTVETYIVYTQLEGGKDAFEVNDDGEREYYYNLDYVGSAAPAAGGESKASAFAIGVNMKFSSM